MAQQFTPQELETLSKDPKFLALSTEQRKAVLTRILENRKTTQEPTLSTAKNVRETGEVLGLPKPIGPEIRPYASAAAGAMSGYAASTFPATAAFAPQIGTAAGVGTDFLLRKIYGEDNTYPISSFLGDKGFKETGNVALDSSMDLIENTTATEGLSQVLGIIGSVIGKGVNVAREADFQKGGVADKIRNKAVDLFSKAEYTAGGQKIPTKTGRGSVTGKLSELDPTFAQYEDAPIGTSLIEDIFSPASKQNAVVNSARKVVEGAESIGSNLAGVKVDISNYDALLGKGISETVVSQFRKLKRIANAKAENIKLIAQKNKFTYSIPQPPQPSNVLGPDGKPVMAAQPPKNVIIEGPTVLQNTLQEIQKITDEVSRSPVKPDDIDKVIKDMTDLADSVLIKDSTGKMTGIKPMNFGDAWETKKSLQRKAGYDGPISTNTYHEGLYSRLSEAIDNDIEVATKLWGGKTGQKLFTDSKAITKQRYDLFKPTGEKGEGLKDILPYTGQLKSVNNPIPAINNIIDDKYKLERTLEAGVVKPQGVAGPLHTNLRSELKGYQFMRLFKESWEPLSAEEVTKGITNADKLIEKWSVYSNSDAGKKLFSSAAERDAISEFISNVKQVSTPVGGTGPSRYLILRLGSGTVQLGTGLVGTMLGGQTGLGYAGSGAGVLGVAISLHGLGRLMTNPDSARIMNAAIKGSPLGMSTKLASRTIAQALRNHPAELIMEDGTRFSGRINGENRFTIQPPQK